MGIPGAGDRMTREFEEYRPYTSIGQFRGEIGEVRLARGRRRLRAVPLRAGGPERG